MARPQWRSFYCDQPRREKAKARLQRLHPLQIFGIDELDILQVVGTDPASDLAVLKISSPTALTVVAFGDSSTLHVGHEVLVIGNPLGITQTVTHGIISALNRRLSEGQEEATISDAIQTDAPINPGNSGGALVDLEGNLMGIPILAAIDPEFNTPANGVGFAIPFNHVRRTVTQLLASGSTGS